MNGGTLFSGIAAPELAAPEIDWRWSAEIDPFARAVLAERFPKQRNLGDVNRIDPDAIEPVDLVVFGSPCQSFSVAGKRRGLGDARGNLAFVALGIIGRIRPRWVVFENVPGLLSSGGGRDFGAILGALAKLGYGFAYRILDAQYCGVPQRRRRVFVVGCLGDWRAAAAVLFEREGLRRDPPPRREAGQGTARALTSYARNGGGYRADATADNLIVPLLEVGGRTGPSSNDDPRAGIGIGTAGDPMFTLQRGQQHGVIAFDTTQLTHPENCSNPQPGGPCYTLPAAGHAPAVAFESRFVRNGRGAPSSIVPPLKAQSGQTGRGDSAPLVVPPLVARSSNGGALSPGFYTDGHVVADPRVGHGYTYTHEGKHFRLRNVVGTRPRRLTPRECERLQGLPDDWTAITYRGKPAVDGPRYRAIGNSMAVPVIRWLLRRLGSTG